MGFTKEVRFEIINELKSTYPVKWLCQLAKVSKSGFYQWQKRSKVNKNLELEEVIKFEFARLKGIYGYRRMKMLLKRKHEICVNHKRVYRLMKKMNLQAVIRRKRQYLYRLKGTEIMPNLLSQDFHATKPNQKWVMDITYLILNGQRKYLSAIVDLFNNEVIAYKISNYPGFEFVIDTVSKVLMFKVFYYIVTREHIILQSNMVKF